MSDVSSAASRPIARLVRFCVARAWLTVLVGLGLTLLALAQIVFGGFKMTADSDELLSPELPYRQNEAAFRAVFPEARADLLVVIDAATPELAETATSALLAAMQGRPDLFEHPRRPDIGFLARNGLLFLSEAEVQERTDQLVRAGPFLGPVALDPSLRGVSAAFADFAEAAAKGQAELAQLKRPIEALNAPIEAALAGKTAVFSWRTLFSEEPPGPRELRKLILADPVLAERGLKRAAAPTAFLREQAVALGLTPEAGVRVRLTGPARLADEEFATLAENIGFTGAVAVLAIVLMVWLAVRSIATTACVIATTAIGLALTMALGLLLFGRFNAISVAFIPLFVGLGIDFCIQVSVRFRAEQQKGGDRKGMLVKAGAAIGPSLLLAAAAISVGFLAFVPTDYVGVSQLGAIAGLGMLIALALSLTLLPALLALAKPGGALRGERLDWLAAADRLLADRRRQVLLGCGAAAALGLALAPFLGFDFNPLHLRSAKTESVSTLLDLTSDPTQSTDALNVAAPSLEEAAALRTRLEALPEVDRVVTLARFVPEGQDLKLPLIQDTYFLLGPTLDPFELAPAPTDADTIDALGRAAAQLRLAAEVPGAAPEAAAAARDLAQSLEGLAQADAEARARAEAALVPPLSVTLQQIRDSLLAEAIALETLPEELTRQWLAPDGRARLSVLPAVDTDNTTQREAFVQAVRSVAPAATGAPVAQLEAGRVVIGAFAMAGVLSFVAILAILFLTLRKPRDVALTIAPIGLTALLTIGSAVAIGQPLNFANIIALPLLFGMGVAYHIYFVMAWREGQTRLLSSPLARAVLFSALTSATGFGSLWLSSHPGTASMGKLLMISLTWTLVSALLFQPALMGPPPKDRAA